MAIDKQVRVSVGSGVVRVLHGGLEVAVHAELSGRHGRVVDEAHLVGVTGRSRGPHRSVSLPMDEPPALLRPLAEYEALAGGRF